MATCGSRIHLAADVVAATYAPHNDQPRELACKHEDHPHAGPHHSEGWLWENGRVWLAGSLRPMPIDARGK